MSTKCISWHMDANTKRGESIVEKVQREVL